MLNEYIDAVARVPVQLDRAFEEEVIHKADKVLALTRYGPKLIYPDVFKIEQEMIRQLPGAD